MDESPAKLVTDAQFPPSGPPEIVLSVTAFAIHGLVAAVPVLIVPDCWR